MTDISAAALSAFGSDQQSSARQSMRRIETLVGILCVTLLWCGCGAATPAAVKPDQVAEPSAVQWVDSDDGLLALRLSAASRTVAAGSPIQITAQLRNTGETPITVLKPFGDWYAAAATGTKIWDAQRRIRYTGPAVTYVIGASAFAVLAPGEAIEDQIELANDNFAGMEAAGTYTLRYDYAYGGHWDAAAAAGESGIRGAWRGTIGSREIQVTRK
jgi:hypothetical protein